MILFICDSIFKMESMMHPMFLVLSTAIVCPIFIDFIFAMSTSFITITIVLFTFVGSPTLLTCITTLGNHSGVALWTREYYI